MPGAKLPLRFRARLYKLGINPCVDVPQRVSRALGMRGHVRVAGTLNRHPFRATLVPKGDGRHRLFVNGEMRKAAQVAEGSRVEIVLRVDARPRVVPVPGALARALAKNPRARAAFKGLTPSRQKEILTYLNWLKNPESVERNVVKITAMLLKGEGGAHRRASD
jgi:hypothetical protein